MKYHAVIFDMDGLLLNSERIGLACFMDAVRSLGFDLGPEIYTRCIGTNAAKTKNQDSILNGNDSML